ncbi:MAG: ATP-binding protein [Immundisolibacter sp.]|jgi:two-component system sensor histidine kinase RegB|uniref:ATP-binding protein n=1 Tax=Immundisolibacter sp. TaxID=1934948 RepID=UPI003D0A5E37
MATVSSSSALLLVHLRSVALATQAAAVLLAAGVLGMHLPLTIDGLILGALAGMNALAWWYARRGDEPSAWVLTAQLAVDIGGLTAFLYFNGGYANPFASLFLLPLAVAATVLPTLHTAGLTALVVGGYTFVMFAFRPLPHYHGRLGDSFDLHLIGMWLSLVVAAVVIAAFVARLAATLRAHEARLAELREAALRSEQLAALGALAAGTAHELGTPLSTMAVLVGELRAAAGADQRADLEVLSEQIDRCRDVLTRNLTITGQGRAEGGGRLGLQTWIETLAAHWQQTRPQARLHLTCTGPGEPPAVVADETLRQALCSLLDNAADASASVDLSLRWDTQSVQLDIADRGAGIPREIAPRLGQPYVTGKPGGLGLGVYLARAVIERLGGTLDITSRQGGGTLAQVVLPLAALAA